MPTYYKNLIYNQKNSHTKELMAEIVSLVNSMKHLRKEQYHSYTNTFRK